MVMGVWDACMEAPPAQSSEFTFVNEVATTTKKADAIIKTEQAEWARKCRMYNWHSRIAGDYIYQKFGGIPKALIIEMMEALEVQTTLKNQYFDQGFAAKRTAFVLAFKSYPLRLWAAAAMT